MKSIKVLALVGDEGIENIIQRVVEKFGKEHKDCALSITFVRKIQELKTHLQLGQGFAKTCPYDLLIVGNKVRDGYALQGGVPREIRFQYPAVRMVFLSALHFPLLAKEVEAKELPKDMLVESLKKLLETFC